MNDYDLLLPLCDSIASAIVAAASNLMSTLNGATHATKKKAKFNLIVLNKGVYTF